jgi:hypothetical protein
MSEIVMRPCINNENWGGGNGVTCGAPTQTFAISTGGQGPSALPTTHVPTTTPAPTTPCLSDEFDGTVLDPQWTYPAGGDGECVLSGSGTLICRDAGNGAHIRTTDTFAAPLAIKGSLEKNGDCVDHYIKVSTESSDSDMPWYSRPGFVTFVWDCDTRHIIGQTSSVSTSCSSEQSYDIEITVDDSTVTFRDAAGACGDLSLPETIGTSGPLYVYVGSDCDGCDAIWYSVEICSGLTTAPGYAPTPAPAMHSCFYMGSRFGDGDWTCPDGMRMPHENEYNAVEECVPDDFVPSDYELGVAYSSTGVF